MTAVGPSYVESPAEFTPILKEYAENNRQASGDGLPAARSQAIPR